jgi:Ion channel
MRRAARSRFDAAMPRVTSDRTSREAGFRYGVVFFVTFLLVVFAIASVDRPWAHAVALGLEGVALTVVVATSRARAELRHARALAVAGGGTVVVVLVGADAVSEDVVFAIGGLLAAAIPAALAGGVVRLIRERGVTLQAVLGALTIYLYVGLIFAWVIGFVSQVSNTPYFAQPDVGHGDRVYFSFTVLTTTGFGDYTPATPVGHALSVVEMLTGQLYLVTVIGVLIGGLVGRASDRRGTAR